LSDPASNMSGPSTTSGSEQPVPRVRDPRPVCVIVNCRARLDKIEQAKVALMKIDDPIRANSDCLDFRVYEDREDPQSFVLWERWVSEDALLAHSKRDYMAEYMAQKDDMFENIGGGFYQEIHRLDVALTRPADTHGASR